MGYSSILTYRILQEGRGDAFGVRVWQISRRPWPPGKSMGAEVTFWIGNFEFWISNYSSRICRKTLWVVGWSESWSAWPAA